MLAVSVSAAADCVQVCALVGRGADPANHHPPRAHSAPAHHAHHQDAETAPVESGSALNEARCAQPRDTSLVAGAAGRTLRTVLAAASGTAAVATHPHQDFGGPHCAVSPPLPALKLPDAPLRI
jgi:hypothetical protein